MIKRKMETAEFKKYGPREWDAIEALMLVYERALAELKPTTQSRQLLSPHDKLIEIGSTYYMGNVTFKFLISSFLK